MRRLALIALLALAAVPVAAQTRYDTPWGKVGAPAAGPSQSIGGPARGCIRGAEALPVEGTGFQVLRRWRNRFWGHPQLIAYLNRLGATYAAQKMKPMLIGDMSQPRGGPMATGHRSHQTGIDVDILFTPGPMGREARETLTKPPTMLRADETGVDTSRFGATQIAMLRLAASDPLVVRIFVNYRIKKHLCQSLPARDRAWLGKLRPWLGHDEHFHVRLKCPPGSGLCEDQDPVAAGDGCDDSLEAWFRPAPKPDPNAPRPPPDTRPKELPAACTSVLSATAG